MCFGWDKWSEFSGELLDIGKNLNQKLFQLSQALIDEKKGMIMEHIMTCFESEKATDGKPINIFLSISILTEI